MHEPHGHAPSGGLRFAIAIALNVVITAAEFVGGHFSGSLALVSDAAHNLSDVLSLALGYVGERLSSRGPNRRFSFGLKRFEVLIALINALLLLAVGVFILFEAIERYARPNPVDPRIMLPIALIGLAGNLISLRILHDPGRSTLNRRSAMMHLFYDALSSMAVLAVGVAIYYTGYLLLDLVASVIIVIMILWSSFGILRDALVIVLQGTPRNIDADAVYRRIAAIGGTAGVHGLHIWSVDSCEVFLSCHLCLGPGSGKIDTDRIITDINNMLHDEFGINHSAIQIERDEICTNDNGNCCR